MFDAEKQLTVLSYIFSFTSRIWPTFLVLQQKYQLIKFTSTGKFITVINIHFNCFFHIIIKRTVSIFFLDPPNAVCMYYLHAVSITKYLNNLL